MARVIACATLRVERATNVDMDSSISRTANSAGAASKVPRTKFVIRSMSLVSARKMFRAPHVIRASMARTICRSPIRKAAPSASVSERRRVAIVPICVHSMSAC